MYVPIQLKGGGDTTQVLSMMARKGINQEVWPPFQDKENAESIINYFVEADGSLIKRKGQKSLLNISGVNGGQRLERWTRLQVTAYDQSCGVYDVDSSTHTVVKNDFTLGTKYQIEPYGDYCFVNSSKDGVFRLQKELNFDGQTVNFTVNEEITGGTSGATAVILAQTDGGGSGTLVLGSVDGTFIDNEPLTGSSGGNGVVNGSLFYTANSTSVPHLADTMTIIGTRMFIGYGTTVRYSDVANETNPPFNAWNTTTLATSGGFIYNRNKGNVVTISSLGSTIIIFYENGKTGYIQTQLDSNNQVVKFDQIQMDREDMGAAGDVLATVKGLIYCNEGGVFAMISVGQPNVPFSDQEIKHSTLLGVEYFTDIDLTNARMLFDPKNETLLIACARNSVKNNLVLTYNFNNEAFTEFQGWTIGDFLIRDEQFYGFSSVNGKIYELFVGSDDDGARIGTTFIQEIKLGSLTSRHDLLEFYANAQLWSSSSLQVTLQTYNRTGDFNANRYSATWTANNALEEVVEYGSGVIGGSAWGGGYTLSGSVNCLNGFKSLSRNVQRVKIKITSSDFSPHTINFFSQTVYQKAPIRIRGMAKI